MTLHFVWGQLSRKQTVYPLTKNIASSFQKALKSWVKRLCIQILIGRLLRRNISGVSGKISLPFLTPQILTILLLFYIKLMSDGHFSPPFTYHLTSACFQLLSTYFLAFTIHLQLLAYYYHRLNGAILSPHVTGEKVRFFSQNGN